MDRQELRAKLEELFVRLEAEITSHGFATELQTCLQGVLTSARNEIGAKYDSGELTWADILEVETEFHRVLQIFANPRPSWLPTPLQMEWCAFAEQLATRQGTRIPDWNEFYADREALERRISEQGMHD